jgi:hypothetical protein
VSCQGLSALRGDGAGVSQITGTAQGLLLKNARGLGADVVKVNFPHPGKQSGAAKEYQRNGESLRFVVRLRDVLAKYPS